MLEATRDLLVLAHCANLASSIWLRQRKRYTSPLVDDTRMDVVMADSASLMFQLYRSFNGRDVKSVIERVHPEFECTIDGKQVSGRTGLQDLWERYRGTIRLRAETLSIQEIEEGCVEVDVYLIAWDSEGNLSFERNELHIIRLQDGFIKRFDVKPTTK